MNSSSSSADSKDHDDNISDYLGNVITHRLRALLEKQQWEFDLQPQKADPSQIHKEFFFLEDHLETGHPAKAREYLLPALVEKSYARYIARFNPNFELKENAVVVPVPLYQDADVEVCWEQSNPFRQLTLHAAEFDDKLDTDGSIQAAIPECCKKKNAWVIETTLAPILANASGVFPTVDLRLQHDDEDEKKALPLLKHYGHMMPMQTEQGVHEVLGTKAAIFYLAFTVSNPHSLEKKFQRGSDHFTHVWHKPSFISVKLLPKVDVVITNLPLLAHITYIMGSAHMHQSRRFLLSLAAPTPLYKSIMPDTEGTMEHFDRQWPGREIKDGDTFENLVHRTPMESMLQVDTTNASKDTIVYLYICFAVISLVHAVAPWILLKLSKQINSGLEPTIADLQHQFIEICITRWGIHTKNKLVHAKHAGHSPVILVEEVASIARSPEHKLVQEFTGLIQKWYSTIKKQVFEDSFRQLLDKAKYPEKYKRDAQYVHHFVTSVLVALCG